MIAPPTQVTVVQIGKYDAAQIRNAVGIANSTQRDFAFSEPQVCNFDLTPFRLSNGGYDLDLAAKKFAREGGYTEPVFFITAEPYGDPSNANEKDDFYFYADHYNPDVAIISTYLWEKDLDKTDIQPFLLNMFGTAIISMHCQMYFHNENKGCIFDDGYTESEYFDKLLQEILCNNCRNLVEKSINSRQISVSQLASAIKLVNRARNAKICFYIMPFNNDGSKKIYNNALKPFFTEKGWMIKSADNILWPKSITDSILLHIFMSDMVVADITGGNPNVFYEIGIADAVNTDMIFLLQKDKQIPFDIKDRITIYYQPNKYKLLKNMLCEKLL